jgi:hypothetical protein
VEDISALERASIEPIGRNGIVDQDAISDCLARRPISQEVEQVCVVELGVGFFRRTRPVASPDHSFRHRPRIEPCGVADGGIGRWSRPGVPLQARPFMRLRRGSGPYCSTVLADGPS